MIKSLDEIRGDLCYIKDVMPSIHVYLFAFKELVLSFSVVFASDASRVPGGVVAVTCSKDGDHQDHQETVWLWSLSKSSRRRRQS